MVNIFQNTLRQQNTPCVVTQSAVELVAWMNLLHTCSVFSQFANHLHSMKS
jgi:hypothetical protein